jgi:hypothetical protein
VLAASAELRDGSRRAGVAVDRASVRSPRIAGVAGIGGPGGRVGTRLRLVSRVGLGFGTRVLFVARIHRWLGAGRAHRAIDAEALHLHDQRIVSLLGARHGLPGRVLVVIELHDAQVGGVLVDRDADLLRLLEAGAVRLERIGLAGRVDLRGEALGLLQLAHRDVRLLGQRALGDLHLRTARELHHAAGDADALAGALPGGDTPTPALTLWFTTASERSQ